MDFTELCEQLAEQWEKWQGRGVLEPDAALAAVSGCIRGESPPADLADEDADLICRVAWLLAAAAPELDNQMLAHVALSLSLLETEQGSWEELFDTMKRLDPTAADLDADIEQLLTLRENELAAFTHQRIAAVREQPGRVEQAAEQTVQLLSELLTRKHAPRDDASDAEALDTMPAAAGLQLLERSGSPDGEAIDAYMTSLPSAERETVRARLLLANQAAQAGFLQQAYDAAEESVGMVPDCFQAYVVRASVLEKAGHHLEALRDVERALALEPSSMLAVAQRASIRRQQGDLAAALADYDTLVSACPDWRELYGERGFVRLEIGDVEGAVHDFDATIRLRPGETTAYYNRGNARMQRHDAQGALADYAKVIEIDPSDAQAYVNRGTTRLSLDDDVGALADLNEAIALDPSYANAFAKRANIHLMKERYGEAIADALTATAAAPEDWPHSDAIQLTLFAARGALAEQGREDEAQGALHQRVTALLDAEEVEVARDLLTSVAEQQGGPEASVPLLTGLVALHEEEAEAAVDALSQAVAAEPNSDVAWWGLGQAQLQLDRLAEAAKAMRQALEHRGEDASWERWTVQSKLGVCLGRLGEHDEAIQAFEQALEERPDHPELWFNKGVYLDLAGHREASIAAYDQCLELDPSLATAWFNRACEHAILGHKAEALDDLGRAIELSADRAAEARGDDYFAALWQDPDFRALVEPHLGSSDLDDDDLDDEEFDDDEPREGRDDEPEEAPEPTSRQAPELPAMEEEVYLLAAGIDDAAVRRAAAKLGWWWVAAPERTPRCFRAIRWSSPDRKVTITYQDDEIMGLRYLLLAGEGALGVAEQTQTELERDSFDELRERWRAPTDTTAAVDALARISLDAVFHSDEEHLKLLLEAMQHQHPTLRYWATRAPQLPAMPEFEHALQQLTQDPDPRVREAACSRFEMEPDEPFELDCEQEIVGRYVLAPGAGRGDVERLATDAEWWLLQWTAPSPEHALELIWASADRRSLIHYVDDEQLDEPYVQVQGRLPERWSELALCDLDAVLAEGKKATTPESIERAVRRAGAVLPEHYHPGVHELLDKALECEPATVRMAALRTAVRARSAELAPLLARVRDCDPDAEARLLADQILGALVGEGAIEEAPPVAGEPPPPAAAEPVSRLVVEGTPYAVHHWATATGLIWMDVEPGGEIDPKAILWESETGKTTARLCYDLVAYAWRLELRGPERETLAASAGALPEVHGLAEIELRIAEGDAEQRGRALEWLGAAAPAEVEPELEALLHQGLESPETRLRRGAAVGAVGTGWEAMRERAVALSQDDPSPAVQGTAKRALMASLGA